MAQRAPELFLLIPASMGTANMMACSSVILSCLQITHNLAIPIKQAKAWQRMLMLATTLSPNAPGRPGGAPGATEHVPLPSPQWRSRPAVGGRHSCPGRSTCTLHDDQGFGGPYPGPWGPGCGAAVTEKVKLHPTSAAEHVRMLSCEPSSYTQSTYHKGGSSEKHDVLSKIPASESCSNTNN
jgi:hypothetical protein